MAWAAVVNGRILPIVWFQEGQSVNTEIYLNLLQNDMWPAVSDEADSESYYFQQDGATPHCAKKCLDFLEEKFPGRVISRRTETPWPAHSPDMSSLDYWFWSALQSVVYMKRPKNLQELKEVVNNAASQIEEQEIRRSIENFSIRTQKCYQNKGGHFEAELK